MKKVQAVNTLSHTEDMWRRRRRKEAAATFPAYVWAKAVRVLPHVNLSVKPTVLSSFQVQLKNESWLLLWD